jgi:hypothetical protein
MQAAYQLARGPMATQCRKNLSYYQQQAAIQDQQAAERSRRASEGLTEMSRSLQSINRPPAGSERHCDVCVWSGKALISCC